MACTQRLSLEEGEPWLQSLALGGNTAWLLHIPRDALTTGLAAQNWTDRSKTPEGESLPSYTHMEARASPGLALQTVQMRNDPHPLEARPRKSV